MNLDRSTREHLRAEYKCTKCGRELPAGYKLVTCEHCCKLRNARRAAFRAQGRCVVCGKVKEAARANKTRCFACALKDAEWSAKHREKLKNGV